MKAFGDLKRWELWALGAAVAAAVVLRVLASTGVYSIPPFFAVILVMIFAGVMTLWRPALALIRFMKDKTAPKNLSAVWVDVAFALLAEGILTYILLNVEKWYE